MPEPRVFHGGPAEDLSHVSFSADARVPPANRGLDASFGNDGDG